jgi:hypothetical protein
LPTKSSLGRACLGMIPVSKAPLVKPGGVGLEQLRSGYCDCACRDCFNTAITDAQGRPQLCSDCEEEGCDPSGEGECQCPDLILPVL